jgi:hypothetical protein
VLTANVQCFLGLPDTIWNVILKFRTNAIFSMSSLTVSFITHFTLYNLSIWSIVVGVDRVRLCL